MTPEERARDLAEALREIGASLSRTHEIGLAIEIRAAVAAERERVWERAAVLAETVDTIKGMSLKTGEYLAAMFRDKAERVRKGEA